MIPVAPLLSVSAASSICRLGRKNASFNFFQEPTTATLEDADATCGPVAYPWGVEVMLWQQNPAYDLMSQFRLCVTTIGANTAELGSLGVPMMVLLPTLKLDVMKALGWNSGGCWPTCRSGE